MNAPLLALILALAGLGVARLLNRLADTLPGTGNTFAPPDCGREPASTSEAAFDLSKVPQLARFRPLALAVVLPAAYALLGLAYGWEWRLLPGCVYLALFSLIAVIDLEHRIIPNELILTGGLAALGFSFVPAHPVPVWFSTVGAIAGLIIFGVVYLAGQAVGAFSGIRSASAVGLGDVKLAILIGLVTGFPAVVGAIFVGAFVGGLVILGLLASGTVGRRTFVPYGPFLLVGATWTYFFALRGYLS